MRRITSWIPIPTSFQQAVAYLQVLSIWLLVTILPFRPAPLQRTIMFVAGGLFLIDYLVNKRWQQWQWTRNKWLYVAMIAYYLLIPLWHIFSDTSSLFLNQVLERRLAFLVCGIIGILSFNQYVKLRHLCVVFMLTAIGTSLYIIFKADSFTFFTYDWGRQSFVFTSSRKLLINAHMVYNMFLNMSLIAAFYLIATTHRNVLLRILYIIAALWIFYIQCLTEGRVGLFTSFLLVASFIIIEVSKRSWKLLPILVILYAIICGWVLMHNQRMDAKVIARDARGVIWKAGWNNVKISPIWGQGVCDAKQSFIEIAKKDPALSSFWTPYVENERQGRWYVIHTHSAFLETWAEFGLIGLAILLFLFIYPLTMLPAKHRIYLFMIVGCVGIQSLFDIFLSPLLYGLIIIFFTSQSETSQGSVSQKRAVK